MGIFNQIVDLYKNDTLIMIQINILVILASIIVFDLIKVKNNPLSRQVMDRMKKNSGGAEQVKENTLELFGKLVSKLGRVEKKAESKLARANLDFTPREYVTMYALGLIIGFGVGIIVFPFAAIFKTFIFFTGNPYVEIVFARILAGIVFAIVGSSVPKIWVNTLIRKRKKALDAQLLEFLLSLAEGVKSSPTVQEALKVVSQELPDPLSTELQKTVQDLQYAKPFDEALVDLNNRIQIPEYNLVISAMQIQDKTGGELERLLRNMAKVFQERQELIGEIKAIVRGPKSTALILLFAPIVLFLAFSALSDGFFESMTSSTLGWIMLGIAGVLYALGAFIIVQLTKYINKVT